jgi:glycosyltransferase involved in cell wall biosynthesis
MQITQDLGVGGLERVITLLSRRLDRSRFEPSVLCLRNRGEFADELTAEGIPVHVLPWSRDALDYLAFLKLARILRAERIDVIHTHNTGPFFHGALGASLAGVRTHIHTDHARPFPDRLRWMVAEHFLSHLAYRVVGVSDHTTANLVRYERIPREKLVTIPNGIELAPARRSPVEVRASLRIPDGAPVVGTAGRLTGQKGLEFLIQAATLLRPRYPDLRVLLVGDGDQRGALEEQARAAGLDDRVHFLGIRMDIPDLLGVFDIYALPSRWEGLPMAVLEAMAAGLPVVASDVGGVPTAIRDGMEGFLVPPGEPAALAGALAKLLSDPDLRARMGTASLRRYEHNFTLEEMTRRYEALYLRRPADLLS